MQKTKGMWEDFGLKPLRVRFVGVPTTRICGSFPKQNVGEECEINREPFESKRLYALRIDEILAGPGD